MQFNAVINAGAAVLALTLSASSAKAAELDITQPQVRVRYGDLDISRPEGAKALMRRLTHASQEVCEAFAQPIDLQNYAEQRRCVTAALQNAVRDVNQPMLTSLLTGKPARIEVAANGR